MATDELLPNAGTATYQEVYNYQRKVGLVIYAAVISRLDITFVVSRLARFNNNPDAKYQKAAD